MGNIVAVRGNKALDILEFKSYLALAMKSENIGVFLGAGASTGVGGKLVSQIWTDFCKEYEESCIWLKANKYIDEGMPVNMEEVFDRLHIAEEDIKRRGGKGLQALNKHRDNLYRSVIKGAVLKPECLEHPERVSHEDSLNSHRQLLRLLVSTRQPGQPAPWIFTPNYDLAIEWAAESTGLQVVNGFTGLHYRAFDPRSFELGLRNTQARGEARFGVYNVNLVKLHGSLTWLDCQNGHHYVREVTSDVAWKRLQDFLKNNKNWPGFLIYPSAAKFFQTTGFIYGELFRRFSDFLSRSNVCLIVNGYSFGDSHINRLLWSALQNPTLQLVLYTSHVKFDEQGNVGDVQNEFIRQLWEAKIPRVTLVGKSDTADRTSYFEDLISDLPEPALLDEDNERMRRIVRQLEKQMLPVTPKVEPSSADASIDDLLEGI